MATLVSVIVPFYGTAQSKQLELVTESILLQERVNIDFIVAGLKEATRVRDLSDLSRHPKETVPEIVRTGNIINNGLRLVKGDFTYITDADILLSNQYYLDGLVQESRGTGTSLKRPLMRRLLTQDFDWFYSMVALIGLKNSVASLDNSQEYIVKPIDEQRHMRVFPKFENGKYKVFIASESDFQEYISNEKNKGSEPRYFNQDRHCGAVFAPTKDLVGIGGYHKGFISWGVLDADAQWKLENRSGMKLIPNRKEFNVIHLDHKKGYFSKPKWEHDKKLQERRRILGFEICTREDIEDYSGGKNGR